MKHLIRGAELSTSPFPLYPHPCSAARPRLNSPALFLIMLCLCTAMLCAAALSPTQCKAVVVHFLLVAMSTDLLCSSSRSLSRFSSPCRRRSSEWLIINFDQPLISHAPTCARLSPGLLFLPHSRAHVFFIYSRAHVVQEGRIELVFLI